MIIDFAHQAAERVRSELRERVAGYRYDHYSQYPASSRSAWKRLLLDRYNAALIDPETTVVSSSAGGGMAIFALRVKQWDKEHFGFQVASIEVLFSDGNAVTILNCLTETMSLCNKVGIEFVSARVNGDQTDAIHTFEDIGFRYYETIIWPVLPLTSNFDVAAEHGVRLMKSHELEDVVAIATENQYVRGHYHCDAKFAVEKVNELYGRWVRTAFQGGRPIIIVENGGKAAGYFVLDLPTSLTKALGVKYGGMRSLALDGNARGQGLGRRLFRGAIAWLREQGCDYVDSGYASKNHVSAKLHMKAGFASVYEEVTLHFWLK